MSLTRYDFGNTRIVYTAADRALLNARQEAQDNAPPPSLELDDIKTAHYHPTHLLGVRVMDGNTARVLKPSDIFDVSFGDSDGLVHQWLPGGVRYIPVKGLTETLLEQAILNGIVKNPGAPLDLANSIEPQDTPKWGSRLRALLNADPA